MSYEHEHTEWVRAVRNLTEMDRVSTEVELRMAAGLCGDSSDVELEFKKR